MKVTRARFCFCFVLMLFADDSLLFRVIKNDSDTALLQKDLSALQHWENTWQMSFNPIKCVLLRISTEKKIGRVAQLVTSLATGACLTADPGVASSIPAQSHTLVEIDHEIISTVILLPSADSF